VRGRALSDVRRLTSIDSRTRDNTSAVRFRCRADSTCGAWIGTKPANVSGSWSRLSRYVALRRRNLIVGHVRTASARVSTAEDFVMTRLLVLPGRALDRAEHERRDAYLAAAVDIVELERRIRAFSDTF
jgi:hypothetical protein